MQEPQVQLPPGGVTIDGSMLEGGGQILRNAAALSAITQTPITVDKIRANRSNPGLRAQHLTALQLIRDICQGQLDGAAIGARSITLVPGALQAGRHVGDTRTAGSCTLLAQASLPCLLMAGQPGPQLASPEAQKPADTDNGEPGLASQLDLRGGTDASMAPPVGYMQHVLLPMLRRAFGINAELQLVKRGFYPKGGGRMTLSVRSVPPGRCLPPIQLTDRGEVTSVTITAFHAGSVPKSVAQRMADTAAKVLKDASWPRIKAKNVQVEVTAESGQTAVGNGTGMLIVAETSGGCLFGAAGIGERGVSGVDIASQAAQELLDVLETGACVDQWLQDQLIIFMALAEGTSRIACSEPTLHTRTVMVVAEALTSAKFTVQGPSAGEKGKGLWTIECQGAGIPAGQRH